MKKLIFLLILSALPLYSTQVVKKECKCGWWITVTSDASEGFGAERDTQYVKAYLGTKRPSCLDDNTCIGGPDHTTTLLGYLRVTKGEPPYFACDSCSMEGDVSKCARLAMKSGAPPTVICDTLPDSAYVTTYTDKQGNIKKVEGSFQDDCRQCKATLEDDGTIKVTCKECWVGFFKLWAGPHSGTNLAPDKPVIFDRLTGKLVNR